MSYVPPKPALAPEIDLEEALPDDLDALLTRDAADVAPLQAAQAGMAYFSLLRDLVRLGESHFVVRLAVLTELASSDRLRWDFETLGAHFSWLTGDARSAVLRSLRKGGWLELVEGQHQLTDRGEALYAVISRVLGIQPQEGDLALGVLNVELSRDLGHEQAPALRHLHHNLRRIVDGAEQAVRSHSEVRVLEAKNRIDRNLAWARRARACMDSLDLADEGHYRVAQEVGAALGELHQWQSVLQRAIGDLSNKRVQLGATGLSMTDVTAFLMRCDVETLADFGRPLVADPVAPLFIILDNVLSEAEYEYVQVPDREESTWAHSWAAGEPEEAPAGELEASDDSALQRFVADIQALRARGGSAKLSVLVPRRSWAESAYRLSLLALGETAEGAQSTDLVPGELSSQPFEVLITGDGSESDRIYSDAAAEISRGVVRLR